jgi:hypothetical protein
VAHLASAARHGSATRTTSLSKLVEVLVQEQRVEEPKAVAAHVHWGAERNSAKHAESAPALRLKTTLTCAQPLPEGHSPEADLYNAEVIPTIG